ncbi:MAG: hypothetical protein ACQCN5_03900 [Candidatus Bathyarchaeia archaeon]
MFHMAYRIDMVGTTYKCHNCRFDNLQIGSLHMVGKFGTRYHIQIGSNNMTPRKYSIYTGTLDTLTDNLLPDNLGKNIGIPLGIHNMKCCTADRKPGIRLCKDYNYQ